MDALKICIPLIIARLHKRFKARLHQRANTAAKHCLLTEKVGFRLRAERGFKHTRPGTANAKRICKRKFLRLARRILFHRHKARNTFSRLVLTPYGMPRTLRSDHCDIDILRRHNLSKMDCKTVCEHKHIARLKVRLD